MFNKIKNLEPIHRDLENLVPYDFSLEFGGNESKKLAQKIKEYYYKDTDPSLDTLEAFIKVSKNPTKSSTNTTTVILKLETDIHFVHGIQKSILQMVKKSQKPIFMYRFSFDGKVYFLERNFGFLPVEGKYSNFTCCLL